MSESDGWSLSARRAWIEITAARLCRLCGCVALRKESVDRNRVVCNVTDPTVTVALRKESVDRNSSPFSVSAWPMPSLSARRAWIEIPCCGITTPTAQRSLSARRAWIEMASDPAVPVARRTSLSARRAWIEIKTGKTHRIYLPSLSARRAWIEITRSPTAQRTTRRRSPQGERG